MKRILTIVLAPLAFALLLAGCKTPQQTRMAFDTTVLLTDSVMQGYVMIAVQRCGTNAPCIEKVDKVYKVYTDTVTAAQKAFDAYQAGGTNYSAVVKLMQSVSAARIDVTKAVLEATK